MTRNRYRVFETAAGFCGIAWSGLGIVGFQLPARSAAETERHLLRRIPDAEPGDPPQDIAGAVAAARDYFNGRPADFSSCQLDLRGQDDLFRRIYDAVRQVGWGSTTTYGAIARELGMEPQGARDVGQAMARNPIPLVIPCHRVLAAGGKVGGFSAPGGAAAKIRMLELEGAAPGPGDPEQQLLPL